MGVDPKLSERRVVLEEPDLVRAVPKKSSSACWSAMVPGGISEKYEGSFGMLFILKMILEPYTGSGPQLPILGHAAIAL